jgi:hypothetical protein
MTILLNPMEFLPVQAILTGAHPRWFLAYIAIISRQKCQHGPCPGLTSWFSSTPIILSSVLEAQAPRSYLVIAKKARPCRMQGFKQGKTFIVLDSDRLDLRTYHQVFHLFARCTNVHRSSLSNTVFECNIRTVTHQSQMRSSKIASVKRGGGVQ